MTQMTLATRPLRRRTSGFTLIEVLVVVAIIALLIAILFPSLRTAKGHARRVACMANLHSIYVGTQAYAHDNRSRFPDKQTLGGWYYRMGYMVRSDPRANGEEWGLPSLLLKHRAIKDKNAWTCADASPQSIKYQNSYATHLSQVYQQEVGAFTTALRKDPSDPTKRIGARTKAYSLWWTWDNWAYRPVMPTGGYYGKIVKDEAGYDSNSGSGEGAGTSTSGMIVPRAEQYFPHSYEGKAFRKVDNRAINVGYADGHAGQLKVSGGY